MRQAAFICLCFLLVVGGCAHQPPVQADDVDALGQCAAPGREIGIAASVLPIKTPAELRPAGSGASPFARRIVVTFARGSLQTGTSLLWTRLTVRTYGGTVAGWTRFQSDGTSIDVAPATNPARRRAGRTNRNVAAVETGAGYVIVERALQTSHGAASTLSLDLLVVPGGMPIDEPAVRISRLWSKDGAPLPRDALKIDLVPLRHPPGYDMIEADIALDFAVFPRSGGGGGAVPCTGSAQTRTTLVDRESVRPALWDLGVSTSNAPRTRWLALSSPEVGVIRAVFESPEAATSFANWVRATQSTQVGEYRLGLFQRAGRTPLRPLVPVDLSSTETFRPLTADDARALRVGPLGEP